MKKLIFVLSRVVSFATFFEYVFEFSKVFDQMFSIICSFFSNDTVNSTCKVAKKSTIILFAKDTKFITKWFTTFRIQIVRIRVKTKIKRFSISQIVCIRICKRCKQNFIFNNKFHEHIREHHVRKFVKNLIFQVFTSKFTCKIKKKSTFICSFDSFVRFIFVTSRSQIFSTKIVSRFVLSNNLNFSIATHKITSKFVKIVLINDFFVSFVSFIFFATLRNQIFSTKIVSQFLSSKCSNFSIATYKINSKSIKNAIVVCSFIFLFISSHNSVRKH